MLVALAAWAALLAPPTVGERLGLEWSAPEHCPAAADVRTAIDANLGRDEFGPGVDAVRVDAVVVEDPQGWRLSVAVTLPEGGVQRDLVSADCSELDDAAGLIIAVALDPLRVIETIDARIVPVDAEQEDEPEAAPMTEPPAPEPPAASPIPSRRAVDVDLRLAGVGEFGSLGVLRGGVGLGAGVVGRAFRVDVNAQYWAPRRLFAFAAEPDAGVAVQQGGVGLRGCLRPRLRALEVSSCVGFEVGAAGARGIGLGQRRRSAVPWAAAVVGQELAWTSRRKVGLWVGVDGMLHVVRPRFTIADLGVAAQTRWVGLRLVAGPTVRL